MNLKEDIKPISFLKSHAAEILKKINETHNPIIITQNGEAKGVFIDTESYENMKNSITLMKLLIQSENDIDEGNITENSEVFKKLDRKFDKK